MIEKEHQLVHKLKNLNVSVFAVQIFSYQVAVHHLVTVHTLKSQTCPTNPRPLKETTPEGLKGNERTTHSRSATLRMEVLVHISN